MIISLSGIRFDLRKTELRRKTLVAFAAASATHREEAFNLIFLALLNFAEVDNSSRRAVQETLNVSLCV